jgi:hypothetical protein
MTIAIVLAGLLEPVFATILRTLKEEAPLGDPLVLDWFPLLVVALAMAVIPAASVVVRTLRGKNSFLRKYKSSFRSEP